MEVWVLMPNCRPTIRALLFIPNGRWTMPNGEISANIFCGNRAGVALTDESTPLPEQEHASNVSGSSHHLANPHALWVRLRDRAVGIIGMKLGEAIQAEDGKHKPNHLPGDGRDYFYSQSPMRRYQWLKRNALLPRSSIEDCGDTPNLAFHNRDSK